MAGPVGVLGGVGDGVGRRVGASAVGALWALWRALTVNCPVWTGPPVWRAAGVVTGPMLCLPWLLSALPGVVAGRDRGGGRSSCSRGPVSARVSSPTA